MPPAVSGRSRSIKLKLLIVSGESRIHRKTSWVNFEWKTLEGYFIRPPALMPEMELHLAASAWFAMASQYHPVSPWSWSHWQRADQEFEPFRTLQMKKSVSTAWFLNCPWYFSEKEFLFYCFLLCFSVCVLSTSIITIWLSTSPS